MLKLSTLFMAATRREFWRSCGRGWGPNCGSESNRWTRRGGLDSLKNLEKFDYASEGAFLKWLTAIVENHS